MKTFLILLLSIPAFIFSQTTYPDTLVLANGKAYTCLFTKISDGSVELIYRDNLNQSTILKAVSRITVEELGEVYTTEKGLLLDEGVVQNFLTERISKIETKKKIDEELKDEIGEVGEKRICRTNETEFIVTQGRDSNKWSFGVLYIPYYSSRVYMFTNTSLSDPDIYFYTENEINLEGQLSYSLLSEVSLTLDFSYTSTKNETRYEEHYNYNNNDPYHSGSIDKVGLSLLDFSLGLKYYFKNIIPGKVTVYAIAGIGKQFAFAEDKYELLFPSQYPSTTIIRENAEEYTEDLNSPWHFNLGFGAEYFFNESLSLVSNIRFLYSATSANYERYYKSEFETRTLKREHKDSYINTRFGLGLNFYF